jgi:phosphoglycolate phosphatase-like HAD superfamily hydrolase
MIHTAGAGMRAMGQALARVCGASAEGIVPDGKTDPMILREALRACGVPVERWRAIEEEVWLAYAELLADELARPDERRRVRPGVRALLEQLSAEPRVRLGLLTGNLEVTARLKLRAFDLDRYFPVGAFGSDCADRCSLGKVALERARRHYQVDFAPAETWVVGDTVYDIEAARAFGGRALAVATGRTPLARLEESLPDAALSDLSDVAAVRRLLLS